MINTDGGPEYLRNEEMNSWVNETKCVCVVWSLKTSLPGRACKSSPAANYNQPKHNGGL